MIKKFVARYMARKPELEAIFSKTYPAGYEDVVKAVISILYPGDDDDDDRDHEVPDPARIQEINDGDYQGTLVYVIAAKGYQPSVYWCVAVSYGSCSHCDTLEGIREDGPFGGDEPTSGQVGDYMTLALHIVQGIRLMFDDDLV